MHDIGILFDLDGVIYRGDSLIAGANVGMQSILVKTGKYREESLRRSEITPNFIINSVADLPELLQLNGI